MIRQSAQYIMGGVICIKYRKKECSKFLLIAPMSSGKSTLINAIIGKRILQTSNFACTSKVTGVLIDNQLEKACDYTEQASDSDNIIKQCKRIVLETNSRNSIISSNPIMFIDTPGENYSGNAEHELETRKVLEIFNNGIIIYVLNATQIGTEDDFKILSDVKSYILGKGVQIIFVLNKIDALDREKEKLDDFIKDVVISFIDSVGISNHLIFPCASEAAFLFRSAMKAEHLSEAECDKLYKYFKMYYKNTDASKRSALDSDEIVYYDGEQYSIRELLIALSHTGILEIENFLSGV